MDYGWDFSEMDIDADASSANLVENHSNIDSGIVPRNDNTQTSSNFLYDNIKILDHQFQTPKSRKNFLGRKNKNRKFRLIPLDQITIGCNQKGIPESRFIVPEESDPNLVKEYSKNREKYDCIQCRSSHKRRVQGKIISNNFYAPEFHLNSCFPISRNVAEKRFEKIKEKTFKKHWKKQYSTPTKLQKSQKIVKTEATISSPIEIITIDSDEEEPYIDNQNFEEECIITEYSNTVYLNEMATQINVAETDTEQLQTGQQEEELPPILQRIKFQNEYLAFLAQQNRENPDQNETVISPFPSNQYFHEFNHPSTRWLKSACQKLNLIYHQNAYQFWAYMNIIYLTENSKPNQIQYLNDGKYSGFRALSFILSGHENYRVKNVIYKYFLENFQSLGLFFEVQGVLQKLRHQGGCFKSAALDVWQVSLMLWGIFRNADGKTFSLIPYFHSAIIFLGFFGGIDFSTLTSESDIIKETIFGNYFTPELWEIIAKLLECRIGIFIDDNLVKYGNWNNQTDYGNNSDNNNEIITLLFQIVGDNYCIVKSVGN